MKRDPFLIFFLLVLLDISAYAGCIKSHHLKAAIDLEGYGMDAKDR